MGGHGGSGRSWTAFAIPPGHRGRAFAARWVGDTAGAGRRGADGPERSGEGDGRTVMEAIVSWAACALVAASAVCDVRTRRIPNSIPLALLGLFVVYAIVGGAGPLAGVWVHFGLGASLLAAGFVLYLTGGFGAGDAKLIAVAGMWSGPGDLGIFLLGLAAGSFALCLFALLPFDATRRLRRELPFAVAVAPAALAVMIPRAVSHGIPV